MNKIIIIVAILAVTVIPIDLYINRGPWYLGCSDGKGVEYLVKVDKKPKIEGNFVKIGKDTFITPTPGMTCRAVTVREVEADSAIDN